MSLNLDKVYTVKSNAMRDMRKAIERGEYKRADLDVSVVPGGYQITRTAAPEGARLTPTEVVGSGDTTTAEDYDWNRYCAAVAQLLPDRGIHDDEFVHCRFGYDHGRPVESVIELICHLRSPVTDQSGEAVAVLTARAGSIEAEAPAEKVLVRTEEWPFAKVLAGVDAALDPNRTAGGDVAIPATPAVKAARTRSRRARTEMAKAELQRIADSLPAAVAPAAKPGCKPAAAPAPAGALSDDQVRLLTALVDAKAFKEKGLRRAERAGVWIKYRAIHDSDAPHNLPKGKLPGLTGGLRRQGYLDIRGNSSNGEIMVTQKGLDAVRQVA